VFGDRGSRDDQRVPTHCRLPSGLLPRETYDGFELIAGKQFGPAIVGNVATQLWDLPKQPIREVKLSKNIFVWLPVSYDR
jgi:hypothetical protein